MEESTMIIKELDRHQFTKLKIDNIHNQVIQNRRDILEDKNNILLLESKIRELNRTIYRLLAEKAY